MPLARFRIRTLIIAVASAGIGFTLAPRMYVTGYEIFEYPHPEHPCFAPYSTGAVFGISAMIGIGCYVAVVGLARVLPRMTTRRWMIAVACVALAISITEMDQRRRRFGRLASYHEDRQQWYTIGVMMVLPNPRRAAYHAELRDKYERAARRPWLAVPPDPPPPE